MATPQAGPLPARRTERLQLSGIRKMMALAAAIPDVIRLEVGEPDFETPTYIRDAVKADLDSGLYTHYTPVAGDSALRSALAAKMMRDCGLAIDPDNEIMISVGGAGALYAAYMSIINPGDEVLLPDPGYPQYTQMTLLADGVPVYYPLREENAFRPEMDELRSRVTERSRLIVVNSPHNPTGGALDESTRRGLAAMALEHDLVVLCDDVYSTLLYDDRPYRPLATLPGMFERTITVNSFSKAYAMTGWRLGYATAPRPLMTQMIKMQSFFNSCASAISQRAGLAALTRSEESQAMTAEYRRRRDWLVGALNGLPGVRCPLPAGAFYVFPNISSFGLSSEDFAARLLAAAHVSSVPGTAFGAMGEGFVRMSFATSLETLHAAVERIASALHDMASPC